MFIIKFNSDLLVESSIFKLNCIATSATFGWNDHQRCQHAIQCWLQDYRRSSIIWLADVVANGVMYRAMSVVPLLFEWRHFHCLDSFVCSVDVLFISLFWWWEFGTHGDSNPCAFQLLPFHSHQWQHPSGIFGTTTTSWKLGLKIFRCRIMKQIERNCFHPNPSSWWKVLLGNNSQETLLVAELLVLLYYLTS